MEIRAEFQKAKRIFEIFIENEEFSEKEIRKLSELGGLYKTKISCYPEEKDNKKQWIFKIQCENFEDAIQIMDAIMHTLP